VKLELTTYKKYIWHNKEQERLRTFNSKSAIWDSTWGTTVLETIIKYMPVVGFKINNYNQCVVDDLKISHI